MATQAAKRGARARVDPVFINKTELAAHLGCNTGTIDSWIADGSWPAPHSRPGERYAIWLRRYWDAYVETGAWPAEAFPDP